MLRNIVRYLEVSDGNMEEGSLRCDANVSVSLSPETPGAKVEIKNMNSFRSVFRALSYEVERQAELLRAGKTLVQETRHWDEVRQVTVPSRGKEEAEDYRYFPDPDLLPFRIAPAMLQEIQATIPELPLQKKERFMREYELPEPEAYILVQDRDLAEFFEACVREFPSPRAVCNFILTEVLKNLNSLNIGIRESKVTPSMLAELLKMVERKEIGISLAKGIFEEMFRTGMGARDVMLKKGISFLTSERDLEKVVREVIEKNPQSVADYLRGKEKALHFLIGQVMRATRGQANPEVVKNLLLRELSSGE